MADFVSIQWLINKTYALSPCVCARAYGGGAHSMLLRVRVKHHQSVILRKLLRLNCRHRRSTFRFPDKAVCLTSRFHLLHHLHIISIHFAACDCLLSHHVSPTPCCGAFSLCESICLAVDLFSLSFSLAFRPITLIPFHHTHWLSGTKCDETPGNNPLLPRPHGDIFFFKRKKAMNIFQIGAIA